MLISCIKEFEIVQPLSFEMFSLVLKELCLIFYLLLLQLVLAPYIVNTALDILFILWDQWKYSEKSGNNIGLDSYSKQMFAIWTPFGFVITVAL